MPAITLDEGARRLLESYHWRGNIRQLKNVAEQISAVEQSRDITADILRRYLPNEAYTTQPMMGGGAHGEYDDMNTERELLYKILFDMRNDINELKRMMSRAMAGEEREPMTTPAPHHDVVGLLPEAPHAPSHRFEGSETVEFIDDEQPRERSKEDAQRAQIMRALRNNNFRRKDAARELYISERTLYRRMKALGIDEE